MPTQDTNLPVNKQPLPLVLSGAENLIDKKLHTGIAIKLSTDASPSKLMVSDVEGVKEGKTPVYITKPLKLTGKNLRDYLVKKKVIISDIKEGKEQGAIARLIADTDISCEAFYYTTTGPLLMAFDLTLEEGLIKDLTGDEDLSALFDIHGASVRLLRCADEKEFEVLKRYAAELEE